MISRILIFNLVLSSSNSIATGTGMEHFQTFPTPPPIGTTTAHSEQHTRMSEILRREAGEKSQNFKIFTEKDLVTDSNLNPYFSTTPKPKNRSDKLKKHRDLVDQQVIAGIPDMSDPCFRRYENSIIVNAQPYERRSSTGLMHCKSHCLNSQIGVYSCRSFVYDNVNRVCDLFAHVGDQSPSRLLKFQTRDYFEPTDIIHCLSLTGESPDATSTITSLEDDSPPSPPPTDSTNTIDKREEMIEDDIASTTPTQALEWRPDNEDCPRGKQPTYLRTEGFELFKHDDSRMTVQSVEECARACTENNIDGSRLNCKSFDFEPNTSTCYFTSEAAVPVGNGQLKQRDDVSYHEKICVNKHFVETCPSTFFSRYPQMILVGFAESVSDSPSFDHCFDTCLNSYQLFGFNCTSGMYYFEESRLNCILNSENRNTQKELFSEENTDIVDYFEVECTARETSRRKMAGVRSFDTSVIEMPTDSSSHGDSAEEDNGSRWESWSECEDGKQTRRKSCSNFNNIEDCAEEVRVCPVKSDRALQALDNDEADTLPTKEEIASVKQKIRRNGFKCPLNECCQVFLSCSYGLRHNSHTKQLEWCRRQCDSSTRKRWRRLLR